MRLHRLDLVRYGKFTGRSLDFGEAPPGRPDFHLVYGPNEAGKSTLFSAFLDLVFGIERLSGYGFLHPYPTMRIGGTVETGGRLHSVFRVKRNQNSLLGTDEQSLPDGLFSPALGAIDRATYQMMFSLDDDSIEKGGETILKSEGELGALLFSASSGLPDSNAILSGLRAKADAFYRPQGRKHGLAELKAELDALKEEKQGIDVNAREFTSLRKALEAAAGRHEAAISQRAELRVSLAHARDRIEALPLLARLRGLRSELAALADRPEPPAAWHAMLPRLQREETEMAARIEQIDGDLERREAEIAAVARDPAVLSLSGDIADLERSELEARHRTAARDMPTRLDERAKIAADIAARLARLDRADVTDPAELLLPAAAAGRIQELAQTHSAINERQLTARRELRLAEDAVREATQGHAALMKGDGPQDVTGPAVLAELLQNLRQNDCLLRQQATNRQLALLQDQLADRLAGLSPSTLDVDALAALAVPDETEIADWTARRTALGEQLKRLGERIDEETALVAAEEARLGEMTRSGGFAADDVALTLRQQRDRAWLDHAQRLDAASARLFEAALQKDDDAVAMRLARSAELAQARALSLSLAERNGRLTSFRRQHEAVLEELAVLRAEISTAANACGLAQDTKLNQLMTWLTKRGQALDTRNQLRTARQDLRLAAADEEAARQRLAQAMRKVGFAKDLPERLEDALSVAGQTVNALQSSQRAQLAAAETLARAQAALQSRQVASTAADADMANWNDRWTETLEPTWLASAGRPQSPQEVVPVLAVLQDLDKLVQRQADLDHRIDGMGKDQAAFEARVRALAGRLSLPVDDDPLILFQAVRERLANAERNESLFERLSQENAARTAERRALAEAKARHDLHKRGMFELFHCDSLAEVGQHLEAAKARARLRERIVEAEADLSARLGTEGAEAAEMILSAVDEPGLRLEMEALEARLEQCDRDASELHAERRDAERALAAVGGGDAAAHIEERRRTVMAEIEERATAYLRLRVGILAAETALRLYRERHRSAMMQRASAAFSAISGGEYTGLATQAEKGEEFLIANAAGGGSKLARDLSKGTRFQLYLALRMAGYHEIAATREPVPFIADDIMETFDDNRAGRAFGLMAEMARVGQVIYLTHHHHLCDIARKACPDVTVHML